MISLARIMFPMPTGLMHRGVEQADRLGDRDAVLAGAVRWSFGDLDRLSSAKGLRRTLRTEWMATSATSVDR
jgi:hypothetical protein